MCGIFGVITSKRSNLSPPDIRDLTTQLFRLSESRGREAAGLSILPTLASKEVLVLKGAEAATQFVRSNEYQELFRSAFHPFANTIGKRTESACVVIGHSRLVTNGSRLKQDNNQPVIVDGLIGVHNGIIVNDKDLWDKHSDLKRRYEVDTEVLLALTGKFQSETGSPLKALAECFSEIKGTASVAVQFRDLNAMALATNNGSLYLSRGENRSDVIFASEEYILKRLLSLRMFRDKLRDHEISRVAPNSGIFFNLERFEEMPFPLRLDRPVAAALPSLHTRRILDLTPLQGAVIAAPLKAPLILKNDVTPEMEKEFERASEAVALLRRCTKCVLPETVPFITFNEHGICHYCQFHRPIELKGREALEKDLAPYRKVGPRPEAIMAFSGGRDSSYGLHYLVTELKLKPIAYTYDWGMVTDLARRNVSRMCSSLGVEHIVVSADIRRKRENIRKNVEAWLAKPHLGMVPLFMAGDKQFFWYANVVKKQTDIKLDIFTMNLLENTPFKDDYTGTRLWNPTTDGDKIGTQLSVQNKLRIAMFYGMEFLSNPGYLNRSLFDTFFAYLSYYFSRQDYLMLFNYVPWREEEINEVLLGQYGWEMAPDTESTWRIGDGTTPFYNYIYYMVGGFSENDTMRSSQVREGQISRERALDLIARDNRPRWESLKWYCETVGLDFTSTIEKINLIPRAFAPK